MELQEGLKAFALEHIVWEGVESQWFTEKWAALRAVTVEYLQGLPVSNIVDYEIEEEEVIDNINDTT